MNSPELTFGFIQCKFDQIDTRIKRLKDGLSALDDESMFNRIGTADSHTRLLNAARDDFLQTVNTGRTRDLQASRCASLASFTPSRLTYEDTLFNFDRLSAESAPKLVTFLTFANLFRIKQHQIEVQREFNFTVNTMVILAIDRILIDIVCAADQQRRLLIVDSNGHILHEFTCETAYDELNNILFIGQQRIYLFSSTNERDNYTLNIFDFRLQSLVEPLVIRKNIQKLVHNDGDICVQTLISLKFYDLDMNFKHECGQKSDPNGAFYLTRLKLMHMSAKLFYLFSFEFNELKFMCRRTGQVLAKITLDRRFTLFFHLSLLDARNDQVAFVSKFNYEQNEQTLILIDSMRGVVLAEKKISFFVSDVNQTPHGNIVLNKGYFPKNDSLTIKFKTI